MPNRMSGSGLDTCVLFSDRLGRSQDDRFPCWFIRRTLWDNSGHLRTGVAVGDPPNTDDLDLDAVDTRDELASRLKTVRIRADLSLRDLETKTRLSSTPLSKTAVNEMTNGVRFPRKAIMIAYLQACGVPDDHMEQWRRTWDRVAPREARRAPSAARQVARSRLGQGSVGHSTPSRGVVAAENSWHFSDPGPVTIICAQLPTRETGSLARSDDPNYTELLSYADLDALIELHGHIRAENPAMKVSYKLSSKVDSEDMSGHVVIIGGIAWNDKTRRLSEMASLPIMQIEDPQVTTGEIFVVKRNGDQEKFLPRWEDDTVLVEDVGLIVRTPNPLNSNRSLTICNGIHSRGVLGAVRSLIDAQLSESNERYISEELADPKDFAILMRVPVMSGQAMTPDFYATDCVLYQWSRT